MSKITQVTVEVMESHNYNNFKYSAIVENPDGVTIQEMDDTRKMLQRLTNKAVEQYQKHKENASVLLGEEREIKRLEFEVQRIRNNYQRDSWTIEQKAIVKAFEDYEYTKRYDYEDDCR